MNGEQDDITIHVDYNPDHTAWVFNDTGDPILAYRSWGTTGARVGDHLVADGWVLHTADGEEYIVGAWDLDGVEDAVAKAKAWLSRMQS